ncbi:MAG: flagellar biosynthetic protein FliR [Paracoccus sp.]|uniref:flagellar biosynthetic protein FliR n=1 Tax=Paracoccus sp. TaxID=267 RepID=UPI000C5AAF1D|nr:flagellar biosynthetic protein FliR [Paracoccus sp. (in: a-proteobacteria)]MBA47570.1 flagellar biosynthetic protein FliR [Paracoccus sp. (in: a-proteobacteria)]
MNWDQLSQWVPGLDWRLVLVYLRVQACVLALPGLGERVIPARVKVGLAMAVSPLLAGAVAPAGVPDNTATAMAQAAGEVVIGAATGLLLRLLALALDVATSAIAATASLSQIIGVQNEAAPHPIGNLMHLGGVAILMALGLPVMVVQLMADSFVLWPPASWPEIGRLMPEAVAILSRSFVLAMMLAAPFTLGGFMFQALSGVINRVMPALPVVFIGSPAAVLLALAGLALLAPLLVGLWAGAVLGFMLPGQG